MQYSAMSFAKYLVEHYSISNLRLNKLLYFIQAYFICETGKKIFKDKIEAWDYGPVIPTIYHNFKESGNKPIKFYDYIDDFLFEEDIDEETEFQVDAIVRAFSGVSDGQLIDLTHTYDTWIDAYYESDDRIITRKSIADYHSKKLKKTNFLF